MSRARAPRGVAGLLGLGVLCSFACLPEDDTPQPGTASFVVRGSAASAALPAFEDGWTVTITQARLTLLRTYQSDPLCDVYSESGFGGTLVNPLYEGDASLARVRGLGPCRSGIAPGGTAALLRLGPGVTEADRAALLGGSAGDDIGNGTTLALEARAVREGEARTISLLLPAQGLFLFCPRENGDSSYTLRSGETQTMVITYDLSRVFADAPLPGGRLRLAPFVRADELGDGDGHTTQRELDNVELTAFAQLGYDIAAQSSLRPLTPLLTHWVAAMAIDGYRLDGRLCVPSGFPGLGGLE